MADKKPPRFDADERTILCALLQYQRESLVRKVDGVSEAAARQQFVGSGTTLLWLMKHMSWAEQLWFVGRFAGQEVAIPDDTVSSSDTVAAAIAGYRETWSRCRRHRRGGETRRRRAERPGTTSLRTFGGC